MILSDSIELRCQDCLEALRALPEGSVDLIIADPPYWKVVSQKWDYQWRTFAEYLAWCFSWLREIYRVLRKGGTAYVFGYAKALAHLTVEACQMGFDARQQIVLAKGIQSISGKHTKKYKMFPVETEFVLMLVKDSKPFIKKFLKLRQKAMGVSSKDINEYLGVKSNGGGMWSFYTGNNIDAQVPTEEAWKKLAKILKFRLPYRLVAQTFNIEPGVTDVWSNVKFYGYKRIHVTQKPEEVVHRLVRFSSNAGDFVVDPFLGSGTSGVVCSSLGRSFLGVDSDSEIFNKAERRVRTAMNLV